MTAATDTVPIDDLIDLSEGDRVLWGDRGGMVDDFRRVDGGEPGE